MLVALLGLMVTGGWLLHVPMMVEIKSGLVPMVFNSGLCFLMSGIAIMLMQSATPAARNIRQGFGAAVVTLCGLSFIENVVDSNLGIDLASLHAWYDYGNTRPGRMAPNSALGFMLIGASIVLSDRVTSKARALTAVFMTFCVLAIGLTGLVGYLLAPDLLFGWARSARMALHTASGMILSSIGIWLNWSQRDWYVSRKYFHQDEKIRFLGSAILVVVTITVGLVGFVLLQSVLEKTLHSELENVIHDRKPWFRLTIGEAVRHASTSAQLTGLEAASVASLLAPDSQTNRKRVVDLGSSLIAQGFRGVALQDLNGDILYTHGQFNVAPEIVAPLGPAFQSDLVWDKELVVRTHLPLVSQNRKVGELVVDAATPQLAKILFDGSHLGASGEIGTCIANGAVLQCFPGNKHDAPFIIKQRSQTGKPLPVEFALAGKSGVVQTLDYAGRNVIAAYALLAPGLGFVVKQDTTEVYADIRHAFETGALIIVLVALLGSILLYSQLHPLATQMRASELDASEKEQEIRTIMAAVGDGILTIHEHGVIQSANASASDIFGYETGALAGKEFHLLILGEMKSEQPIEGHFHDFVDRPNIEVCGMRKNGTSFPIERTLTKVPKSHLFVGVLRDISARKEAESALHKLARQDSLTGLPNRFLFMDRLHSAMLRSSRSASAMALMFLDLDGFKKINDSLGHQAGDELLVEFARRLSSLVRKTDTVARLAGDEFTIILESLVHPEMDAQFVARKVIESMQQPFLIGGSEVKVTASIGLVIHQGRQGEVDVAQLLERADQEMYAVKHSGKNAFRLGT
ncbi:hypothetical protein BH11PSE11_BH11PSE11_07450 [soil metagenome]